MLSIIATVLVSPLVVTVLRFILSLAINKVYNKEFYLKEEFDDALKFLVVFAIFVFCVAILLFGFSYILYPA